MKPRWAAEPIGYTNSGNMEPLSLADDVKPHLRIHSADTDDDTYLSGSIQQAREFAEGQTGLSLVTRTWDLVLDGFCGDVILLPHGPVSSVTSIKTVATDDTETTFDNTKYTFDASGKIARVFLDFGEVWPVGLRDYESVRVQYVAGYSNADEDNKPVIQLRRTMLQYIKLFYDAEREGFLMSKNERYKGIIQSLRQQGEFYGSPFPAT